MRIRLTGMTGDRASAGVTIENPCETEWLIAPRFPGPQANSLATSHPVTADPIWCS
jgi:hypothetical protein